MLASIFNKEVLSWNASKSVKNEDSQDIESENELRTVNAGFSHKSIFQPKLNEEIFRDRYPGNEIIECF